MKTHYFITLCAAVVVGATLITVPGTVFAKATEKTSNAQELPPKGTSYAPVDLKEDIAVVMARMKAAKPEIMKRQMDLLKERYDLANRPAKDVTMSRGKPVQEGIRVILPQGLTWEKLQAMSSEEILEKDSFPAGFFPLPHPNHPEGGMVFPTFHIEEIQKQEGRDLTRFDLDFDLPAHFLPEFPPPIYLTTQARSRRPVPGQIGDHRQLLRILQRNSESETARGFAAARHHIPAAAIQPDGRSSYRPS